MTLNSRTRSFCVTALGVTIMGGAAAATLIVNPAAAAGVGALVTTVTCSVTGFNWCISGNNTSSGIGVIGTSKTGTGLRGTSTSQYGLKATSVSNSAILAQTATGSSAIFATAGNGYGVSGTTATGLAGVYGYTKSEDSSGVAGESKSGFSFGVSGSTLDGTGIGVYGYEGSSGTGAYGASMSGNGVLGSSSSGYGVVGTSGGYPIVAANGSGKLVAYINSAGDLYYHGSLKHFAATPSGTILAAFSPETAAPTVEDTGTAQLVAGTAAVRLDAAFAASIDPSAAYRVFITPDGDTPHGLFVATKTPAGFVVREAQGGRSTVGFDYRIVASALGQAGQRMGVMPASAVPHAALPAVVAPQRIPPPTIQQSP